MGARIRKRLLAPRLHAADRLHELGIAKAVAQEVHVPEPCPVRDGVSELAVEESERLDEVRGERTPVALRLEPLEIGEVVPFVEEELAVKRRGREILPRQGVAAHPAPVVGVRRGKRVQFPNRIRAGRRTVVALDRPRLVLRIAVERERDLASRSLVLHRLRMRGDHVRHEPVVALEVVWHLASLRRIAPAVRIQPAPLSHRRHGDGLEGDGVVLPRRAQLPDRAVLRLRIRGKRTAHRLGEVTARRRRVAGARTLHIGIPAEVLAPRTRR